MAPMMLLLRRQSAPMAWLFVLLVLTVAVQHRIAVFEDSDVREVTLNDDEDVEGQELLNKLIVANDLVIPIVPHVTRLDGERPVLLTPTALSLLALRGLSSRAPPARSISI